MLSDLFKPPALDDPAIMEWERLRPDDDSVAVKTIKFDKLKKIHQANQKVAIC